jgi:glutathione S-transferase
MTPHTLYNYRRCPYAMRARMALVNSKIQCKVHDIDFRNKPAVMLDASPKGTVPVLITNNNQIIDESLDIMLWALKQNDPEKWTINNLDQQMELISENDTDFKKNLDRYKYPNRFDGEDCSNARENAVIFLEKLNERLSTQSNLFGNQITMADIAIFPFIRQFANVDHEWFDTLPLTHIKEWLKRHLSSNLFKTVFKKQKEQLYYLL